MSDEEGRPLLRRIAEVQMTERSSSPAREKSPAPLSGLNEDSSPAVPEPDQAKAEFQAFDDGAGSDPSQETESGLDFLADKQPPEDEFPGVLLEHTGEAGHFRLAGDCSIREAESLHAALMSKLPVSDSPVVTIDVSAVTAADITCGQILLALQRSLARNGTEMVLVGPEDGSVQTMISMAGLITLQAICQNDHSA